MLHLGHITTLMIPQKWTNHKVIFVHHNAEEGQEIMEQVHKGECGYSIELDMARWDGYSNMLQTRPFIYATNISIH